MLINFELDLKEAKDMTVIELIENICLEEDPMDLISELLTRELWYPLIKQFRYEGRISDHHFYLSLQKILDATTGEGKIKS